MNERGDFIVTFMVRFPASLSTEGRQLIKEAFRDSETSE